MATTYAELQTEIADFLNRDDLTATIPTFIKLAEAGFNRDIRHYEMESRQTADTDDRFLTRPSDWLETIRMNLTGNGTAPLRLMSVASMQSERERTLDTSGTPMYYAHVDGKFELFPSPSSSVNVELLYFAKIPALTVSNTSNWLLNSYPDLYLYASLMHTAPYLQEDTRVELWTSLYRQLMEAINYESNAAKWSGSGLVVKNRGVG